MAIQHAEYRVGRSTPPVTANDRASVLGREWVIICLFQVIVVAPRYHRCLLRDVAECSPKRFIRGRSFFCKARGTVVRIQVAGAMMHNAAGGLD